MSLLTKYKISGVKAAFRRLSIGFRDFSQDSLHLKEMLGLDIDNMLLIADNGTKVDVNNIVGMYCELQNAEYYASYSFSSNIEYKPPVGMIKKYFVSEYYLKVKNADLSETDYPVGGLLFKLGQLKVGDLTSRFKVTKTWGQVRDYNGKSFPRDLFDPVGYLIGGLY